VARVSASPHLEDTYELFTRGGTQILWGRAPSSNAPGEIPAAEKVARLEKHVAQRGALDGPNAPRELDIRGLESARPLPHTAGRPRVVRH